MRKRILAFFLAILAWKAGRWYFRKFWVFTLIVS